MTAPRGARSDSGSDSHEPPASRFADRLVRFDWAFVGGAKLAVSLVVLASGFRAVSDDDYARLVIAQRFAEAPSLDPSGTSWLPAPFWLYGGAATLFGPSLSVARALAISLGVAATLAVWLGCRWFGATRLGATFGALLAASHPWSAWLGAATLPEAPAAGLCLLAMAALGRGDGRVRWLGALALLFAGLSRYEAWPVALVFALFTLADARRFRSPSLAGSALFSLAPCALWLLHGVVQHGDALFFWRRVADYKHALGGGEPLAERLLGPLVSLFTAAPVLWVAAALALAVAGPRNTALALKNYSRAAVAALALVAFLMVGEAGGGAPTHHGARALLPVWFLLAAAAGPLLERWLGLLGAPSAVALLSLGSVALAAVPALRPDDFADRSEELELGRAAREFGASRLVIDTPDFGYFAVIAGYGLPSATRVVDERDPWRSPRAPASAGERLRAELARSPGAWLVASPADARGLGVVRSLRTRLALIESH